MRDCAVRDDCDVVLVSVCVCVDVKVEVEVLVLVLVVRDRVVPTSLAETKSAVFDDTDNDKLPGSSPMV